MTELYQALASETSYIVKKFDEDFECLATYELANGECDCPRGQTGKPCRHQKMLHEFINRGHVGDGWFLNYATKQWAQPVLGVADDSGLEAEIEDSAEEPVPSAREPEQAQPAATVAAPAPNPAKRPTWRRV